MLKVQDTFSFSQCLYSLVRSPSSPSIRFVIPTGLSLSSLLSSLPLCVRDIIYVLPKAAVCITVAIPIATTTDIIGFCWFLHSSIHTAANASVADAVMRIASGR